MVEQYGLGGGSNGVPATCLDFGVENVNNPAEDVRKLSIALLSTAYNKDPNRTEQRIGNLKDSIQDQIREGSYNASPPKGKKK